MRSLRSLWAAGLLLRRLRGEGGVVLLIVILVSSTSFVFAAAPRLFNRVSDDALRYAVRTASPTQRSLGATLTSTIGAASGEGIGPVQAYGDRVEGQLPESLHALIAQRVLRITSVRLLVADPPNYDTRVSLHYQDGLTDATLLIEGRWPVERGVPLETEPLTGPPTSQGGRIRPIQPTAPSTAPGGRTRPTLPTAPSTVPAARIASSTLLDEPNILEGAISTAAAAEIGVTVGDRLAVSLDGSDAANLRVPYRLADTEVEIVGLFEAVDETAAYWSGDTSLVRPVQLGSEDDPVAGVAAYFVPEMYPSLASSRLPFRYEWRFLIDAERLDASQVPGLQSDLRRLGVVSGAGGTGEAGVVEIRTGLPAILERFTDERARTATILSIATIGPFGLAAGAMAMVALLLVRRRRAMLALARGRGASGSLVIGAQLWESIVIAGGAALAGLLLALALVPARASPLSATLAIAVAAVATALLVGASWSTARRSLGNLERDDTPVFRVTTRRLVIEGTIVFLAVGATLLLRQRGLGVGTTTGATGATAGNAVQFDPLLAAVPVVAGLAAGIVALRLYPLPIRALGWLAAKRRDFVPVLGLRTIGRHPGAANLPLLVLLLTAAFGAFSSVLASSINRGQETASYLDVGADFRVERIGLGSLAPAADIQAVAGVETIAPGLTDISAPFATTAGQRSSIFFEAVQPADYARVVAGTPAEPRWPQAFLEAPTASPGSVENPIPALVSTKLPTGSRHLDPGDTFRVTVVGTSLAFRVVEQRDTFPGLGARSTFAIVSFEWLRAAFDKPPSPSVFWVRGSDGTGERLATAVAAAGGQGHVVSRYEAFAALHDAPLEAVIATAYATALVIAVVYMAMAIVGAMVLSAVGRTRDLAYLRTLGVTARQALGLTVMEHGPPVVLALIPGVALGIAIAALVEPGLGLATFVGLSGVPLYVDWTALALLAGSLIGVVGLAVAIGTWLSRRARMADALRIGEH